MKILTKSEIFSVNDSKKELVEVPEWGGAVYVRALTGVERDKFEKDNLVKNKKGQIDYNLSNIRARLVALTVVDETGARMFEDEEAAKLGGRNAFALDRLFTVAQKLSGITKEDVEEMAKNSVPDLSDSTSSL